MQVKSGRPSSRMLYFIAKNFPYAAAVLLLVMTTSCAEMEPQSGAAGPVYPARGGYVSLFLSLKEDPSPPVRVHLQSMELLSESGVWHSIASESLTVDAMEIGAGQVFLGRKRLEPGQYGRIRMTLSASFIQSDGEPVELEINEKVVEYGIPSSLLLRNGGSHSLFLSWDVASSLLPGNVIRLALQVTPGLKKLIADAAYVACPDINTVYMIRTDKNVVSDSLGVNDGPAYLFANNDMADDDLFVLTVVKPGLKRVNLSSNRVVETYFLPMHDDALHMALGPNNQAYIVSRYSGMVMQLDLQTGHLVTQQWLGNEPVYIMYLKHRGLLAVSLSQSQQVVMLDPETLSPVEIIATGEGPNGMFMDENSFLYIAESGSNSVQVYDLDQNRGSRKVLVDFSPRRIESAEGNIYVGNYGSRNISVLRQGQVFVSRIIPLSGAPLELASVPSRRWIYVGNEERKNISVIDPVTNEVVSEIQLGCKPGGMAVIGENT